MENNDKRQAVFVHLVEAGERRTPSEIGDAINETRQTVKYHLDRLVEQGLVINDGEGYRPQPVFTDDEFEGQFVDALGDLMPAVIERIEVDPDLSGEEQATVVFNCVRMYTAMEVLGGVGQERPAAADGSGD